MSFKTPPKTPKKIKNLSSNMKTKKNPNVNLFKTPQKTKKLTITPSKFIFKTPQTQKIKIPKNTPIFLPNDNEGIVNANITVLINLMGRLIPYYLEKIDFNGTSIKTVIVNKPMNPPKSEFIIGQPMLFNGSRNATHFTCTVDGINLWDSYKNGIQQPGTDNFCQTYSFLKLINYVQPNSFIGKQFNKLSVGNYVDNSMVALQTACYFLRLLFNHKDVETYYNVLEEDFNDELNMKLYDNSPEHYLNPIVDTSNHTIDGQIKAFIDFCMNITKEELCDSPLIHQIIMS
jgi:hypothetical protein